VRPATARAVAGATAAGGQGGALLINGDDLAVTDRHVSVMLPSGASAGASVLSLDLAGQRYVVPIDAMPYLGKGLDPSLFDVTALAKG
jgi:hypothetical protein